MRYVSLVDDSIQFKPDLTTCSFSTFSHFNRLWRGSIWCEVCAGIPFSWIRPVSSEILVDYWIITQQSSLRRNSTTTQQQTTTIQNTNTHNNQAGGVESGEPSCFLLLFIQVRGDWSTSWISWDLSGKRGKRLPVRKQTATSLGFVNMNSFRSTTNNTVRHLQHITCLFASTICKSGLTSCTHRSKVTLWSQMNTSTTLVWGDGWPNKEGSTNWCQKESPINLHRIEWRCWKLFLLTGIPLNRIGCNRFSNCRISFKIMGIQGTLSWLKKCYAQLSPLTNRATYFLLSEFLLTSVKIST